MPFVQLNRRKLLIVIGGLVTISCQTRFVR
jgi:hypothetical protein